MEKTGNEKLIEQLLADGCNYMFGNPGTVEQGFLDAMGNYDAFQYITCLQESIAVAMADGYARKTGNPAVVQLHSGVGLGNGIGMLYQAMRGHSPLVVLAGEAGIKYEAMDAQMACDLTEMARTVTKWQGKVLHKDSLLRMVRRAVKIAMTPPMGPVFLALPLDILDEINTELVYPSVKINTNTVPARWEDSQEVADILMEAENPLFIIGDGISFSNGQKEIQELAEMLGAKVYGADTSLVNFDRSSYLYQGDLGHMFGESSREKVRSADVVLIAGTYIFPEVFPSIGSPFRDDTKIIHIDLDTYEVGKNFGVTIGIGANPASTIRSIVKMIKEEQSERQIYKAADRKKRMEAQWRLKESEWKEEGVLSQFCKCLKDKQDENLVIFDEALTSSDVLNHYFPMKTPGTFFQTRGGSLGVGIPGAMGIKLADPEQIVIGFTGDGGSMYTIQALQTAARYQIGAKFVIINNGDYRLLKNNMDAYWREEHVTPHTYPDCFNLNPSIDFVKLAESMSVKAKRLSDIYQAEDTVHWLLKDDLPALVEIKM